MKKSMRERNGVAPSKQIATSKITEKGFIGGVCIILAIVLGTIVLWATTAEANTNEVYTQNRANFESRNIMDDDYRILRLISNGPETRWYQHESIQDKADTITAGLTNEMDKARAIHLWVASNIEYDIMASPISYRVLETRRADCNGYARLTIALLQAADIPARSRSGFVIGQGNSGHVWYEAFVDGRWIMGCTTWDDGTGSWFDVSLRELSEFLRMWAEPVEDYPAIRFVDGFIISRNPNTRPLLVYNWPGFIVEIPDPLLLVITIPSETSYQSNELTATPNPIIIDGRTMLPLRATSEALGATVQWDGELQRITLTRDNRRVTLTIGSERMHIEAIRGTLPYFNTISGSYISGTTRTLDVPPMLIDDLTFVPVRAISEAFGLEVQWDESTRSVRIYE